MVRHLIGSELQSPTANQAVRPDEGLQADLGLLCSVSALLPEQVGVQARQPQALPPHSQRQRRVPQLAQLLCAAQSASLKGQSGHSHCAGTDLLVHGVLSSLPGCY